MEIQPTWRGRLCGFDHAQQADFLCALSAKRLVGFEALEESCPLGIGNIRTTGPGLEKDLKIRIHE
jgi:hypothetical protein